MIHDWKTYIGPPKNETRDRLIIICPCVVVKQLVNAWNPPYFGDECGNEMYSSDYYPFCSDLN